MTIVIRPMAERDVESVATIESEAQPNPWSEKIFRDELAAPDRAYLVAEDDDHIIGFGGVMVVGDDAHVTNLLVMPESRREGTGTALLVALIQAALDLGAVNLTLEVRSRNQAARGLYAKFGLAPVGVRTGYYGDDDALIMWAHDISAPEYLDRIDRLGTEYQVPDAGSRPSGARS